MRAKPQRRELALEEAREYASLQGQVSPIREFIPFVIGGVFLIAAFAFAGNYMGQNAVARTSAKGEVQASLIAPTTDLAGKGSFNAMGQSLSITAFNAEKPSEPVVLDGKGDAIVANHPSVVARIEKSKARHLSSKIVVTPASYSSKDDDKPVKAKRLVGGGKTLNNAALGKPLVVAVRPEGDAYSAKRARAEKQASIAQSRVMLAEENCLARAVYFEARSESTMGQLAVAKVILNRVKTPGYPKTICGVVYQGTAKRNSCQFSFACDGMPDDVRNPAAWAHSKAIAQRAIVGTDDLSVMSTATNYHADYVQPRWASGMRRLVKIGRHVFYAGS